MKNGLLETCPIKRLLTEEERYTQSALTNKHIRPYMSNKEVY